MAKKRNKRKATSRKKQPKSLVQFKQRLWGQKKYNPKKVFRELHAFRDFQEMRVVAKYVASQNNSFHHFIFGIPFAKSYTEVRSLRFFAFTDNLKKDLDWMSLSIVRYAKELSIFVEQTLSFQKAFLLGAYEEANAVLESITGEFGPSLWVLEKSCLLAEYASGLEANKKLLTQIVGNEKNDALLRFISEYVSLRCETKLSAENYNLRLIRAIEDIEGDFPELSAYIRYRLVHLSLNPIPVATLVTYFEGPSPVVDRYLTFIAILQSCAVAGAEFWDIAANVLYRVDGLIHDLRIDALLQFFIPERKQEWSSLAAGVLDILDNYTDGNYESSAKASAKLLIENPEVYELYYVYIRSLEYMKKSFIQVFPKDSVAASILEHTNVVIRGEKSWRGSSDAIFKLSLSLWRDPLAYGLYDFYVQDALPSPEKRFHKLALLNASSVNPRFAMIYGDPDKANKFLGQLSHRAGKASTLSLIRGVTVTSHNVENYKFPQSIPETRRRVYSALIHEAASRPQLAISVLKPLLTHITEDKLPGGFHTRDRVTRVLFRCYLDTKELAECTDMVVRSFLQNELSTMNLPLTLLVDAIDETSPPDVMRRITYPLLYSIIHTKVRAVYVAYDNFLNSLGVCRPTQLLDIADQFRPEELHKFLFRVCTVDVLACSYHFTGTKDLEAERIRICQFLSEMDKTNLKAYSDEISTITSRSLIREGMRQIDVSKIYVDEMGVRTAGRRLLEESFERYRELASMSSIETLRMLTTESLHLYQLTKDGRIVKKPISIEELEVTAPEKRVVHSSLFRLFKELFIDVRDRFISSGEHGLDGYLSVRIRHGVLQNQIRSTFEALHLISEKDTTTGEYLPNPYWDTILEDVSEKSRLAIQELLANFSREVDEAAQKLNKEMIQVRTEKKNSAGLFNYAFSTAELFRMFEDEFVHIADFDQFLDGVFRVLWTRTQANLECIRRVISVELQSTIYDSISQLDREIRNIIAPSQAVELLQNIARCQTDLQYSLESVAKWFTISRSSLVPQFGVDDLVKICIESINNIYPHKKIHPITKFDGKVIIDGGFFAPFFDIVRTLMDNVLVHSGVPPEKMNIEIETKVADGRLTMRIMNSLGQEVRQSDPIGSLNATHLSVKTSEITGVIAREGGSGLMKVRKIMAIDLQRKDSLLDFMYDKDGKFTVMLGMEMEGLRK